MERLYRKGVQAIILDEDNKFLLVQLQNYKDTDWNFVGGGLDPSESLEDGVKREMKEELNLDENDYEIIVKSINPIKYEFPQQIEKEGFIYHGQIKEQFLVKFIGDKSKIKLQIEEIKAMKWVEFSELKDHLLFPGQYQSAVATIGELAPGLMK